ncbi:hypothetical protein [Flagellimonas sp. CMM7]|uniref:hypothetical protein n=1 Tax=Flagellimonas sp. CMM7 TaxID=2654676 RepID=UPI0013D6EE28|nr:hypothetical protein [Flagellimonas sp. CMM7]UII80062.1 hypothetical protein LV704_00725 [Flagellimonas sp. CMM7]
MKIDFNQVQDIEIDGVDTKDYPDFCDAFIARCDYKGKEATEEELDAINEQCDNIHELAYESLID